MKRHNKFMLSFCLFGLGALGSLTGHASSGGKGPAEGVNYIEISPPLIVNYGGPSGKVKYIKAELSVRTENAANAIEVTHHLPLIRDKLISILSVQTEEVINTPEGKEYLRLHALTEINKALHKVRVGNDELTDAKSHLEKKSKVEQGKSNKVEKIKKPLTATPKQVGKVDRKGAAEAPEIAESQSPASDLLFNNFVVQK